MLKNYIKIAFRNLWRHKAFSLINIAGLAAGITICFTIFLWIQDEMRHDRFHEQSGRIYRSLWDGKVGDNEWIIPAVPVPVGTTLEREFPEVERVANMVVNASRVFRLEDEFIRETRVIFADPTVFDVFTFRFLSGDPETALSKPNSVVLTEETARRYFGNTDPLGKTLELNNGTLLRVTGVVEAWPEQSHIQFNFMEPLSGLEWVEQRRDQWGSAAVRTYFLLREGAQIDVLQEKLDQYVGDLLSEEPIFAAPGNRVRFPSQALTDIHLRSRTQFGMDGGGDIRYVALFSVIGLFILILACINFINLTTARSTRRMREIGLRKVMGSLRVQLIRQFLAESFMYVIFAVLLAILFTELALPLFNDLAGKQMRPDYFGSPMTLGVLLGLTVIVGLLAGGYPAFYLSSFVPVRALKSQISEKSSRNRLQNSLVVMQFCVSVTLIVGTLVVQGQLKYMQEIQLGFKKEEVVVVSGAGTMGGRHDAFIRELETIPGVMGASATQTVPGDEFDSTVFEPEQPAQYEQTSLNYTLADYNFVEVLGLRVVQGRNFSRQFPTDSSAFLINQSAAEALGWDEPVGKMLSMGVEGTVIGVVEDFHYESLHSEIQPLVLPFIRWMPRQFAIRIAPGPVNERIEAIRQVWNSFVPQQPFNYTFLDQNLQTWYDSEKRVADLFGIFTLLALFIASLGLAGLAAYTTEMRTKEIGIRKVMGASVSIIILLLNKDFVRLVLTGFVIAIPVAWYAMNRWLQEFAYRIEIGPGVFLLAGSVALLIALVTVSWQSVRAAIANPVDSLRME